MMPDTLANFVFNDEYFLFDDDEPITFIHEDEPETGQTHHANSWNIMIVDDDAEMHKVTKFALQSFKFENKNISFTSAYSGEEAKQLIAAQSDVAIILLDVVMESNDSGLQVAKHIREVTKNNEVRIILRTGQPGNLSEDAVILNYDINDYKIKTELTHQKLLNTIILALRSYRDVMNLDTYQKQLIELTNNFAKYESELKTAHEQLQQAVSQKTVIDTLNKERDQLRHENERLEKCNQRLEKLNIDKNKLFTIIAHDLKEPFQPLLGYSEILRSLATHATRAELQDMGEQIHYSTKNLYHLLENLLQWSRSQLQGIKMKAEIVQLRKIIDENIKILQQNAQEKNITLYHTVADNFWISVDRNLLNAALRNLISNALKFTPPEHEVCLSAKRSWNWRHEGGPTELVEVAVSDQGVGISHHNLKKLFQINSHHTTLGTADEKGTGLGLILCKEMIELNGGEIWIESQLGKGTTVRFTIPVSAGPDP